MLTAAHTLPTRFNMASMTMHLKVQAAQIRAGIRLTVPRVAAPRLRAFQGLHSATHTTNVGFRQAIFAARPVHSVRAPRLVVEAAKKSVGDLGKVDLEGKVVLVRLVSSVSIDRV